MSELFKGPDPVPKPCYECKNFDSTRQRPWCMKASDTTERARAYKTPRNDCWESKKYGR